MRRRRAVIEYMPEMAATTAAMYLVADHAMTAVRFHFDRAGNRVVEARPTCSTLEFHFRCKQRLIAGNAPERAGPLLVQQRAAARHFGAVLAHVFLRGLAVQLGFKTATVTYDRLPRLHGETKYTLAKMVALSVNGITSLSVRPIRLIALMGIMQISIPHRKAGFFEMFDYERPDVFERAEHLLSFVGLYEKRFLRAGSLSFGQQKLLEFAMESTRRSAAILLRLYAPIASFSGSEVDSSATSPERKAMVATLLV